MSLFSELKRRNVFRVAIAYIVMAWLVMQVADVILNNIIAPGWVFHVLLLFLAIGLPFAMFFAWAFELTPEGLKREHEVDRSQSITHKTGRKLDFAVIAVLALVIVLLVGKVWFGGDSVSPDTATTPDKSIAVLPFDNRSADAEDAEFIAAGVHDELLTLLSKLSGLRVISRTSVERLDYSLSIPEIGALLGVATVLEGQVQRAGDRLRINIQLIDAMKEDSLWATTYDRELTAENVFDVQSDIARTIATALRAQLSESDEALLSDVPTENTEALSRYLLGREHQKQNTFESLKQARQYFKEAVELDPEYAQAWLAIADNANQMHWTGMIDVQEYIDMAGQSINRALELDDRLPEAHAQLAVLNWRSGDFEAANSSFNKALDLNPNDSGSLTAYALYLYSIGQLQEAISILERLLEDDPLSVSILFMLGQSEMNAGQPDQFVIFSKRILEIDPSNMNGFVGLLQAYRWQGRYDLAWPWIIKALTTDPDDFELWAHTGLYSNQVGAPEWADRYLDRALEFAPDEPSALKCSAQVLALRGKNDEALAIARRALNADLDDRMGSNRVFLRLVRDDAFRTGDFNDARAWYRNRYPELFADVPEIKINNVTAAADLALLLQRSGEPEVADTLIDTALAWYREIQVSGTQGNLIRIAKIEFLALSAEKRTALDALADVSDVGWGYSWQWHTSNENFSSLRNEPEFQAIIAQFERNMAAQLEAIRALPYMGEFDLRSAQSD